MTQDLSSTARFAAAAVGLAGLASLGAQSVVSYGLTGGVGATIWVIAGYFTVLTNVLVTLTFLGMTAQGASRSAGWHAGLTLWILIVGVVYHLVLAELWAPTGMAWWADQGLHTAVPALAALWWIGFAPKQDLLWKHAGVWLGWPVIYVVYALIRGLFTERYPYPFLDVTTLGYGGVAVNSLGLMAGFTLGGVAMVAVGKALSR